MKITRIEPIVVGAPTPGNGLLSDKNYLFVKVHTDEGITGLGEASLEGYRNSILGMLKDLEELVIGEDPRRIEYLTQIMTRQKFWRGGVVKGTGVAGIELACWDILGKSLNTPVCKLVGGACRDRIRVYANGWTGGATDPAEVKDRAQAALAEGYQAFKFSLALPSWPLYDPITTRRIATFAGAVRDAIGPDCLMMFDGHGRYDARSAIEIAHALAEHDLCFFEEPVPQLDEEAMAEVARRAPMPIAAGERLECKQDYRRLLEKKAVSVVQPDVAHCNGFGEALKIAHLAEAFSAFVAPHNPLSPVVTTISMHLDAVVPNFLIQEMLYLHDWRGRIIQEPIAIQDGFAVLPDRPGWGIELNDEICASHPPISVTIPRLFREDGAVNDW
jgi:galactonate dehydratase